MTVPEKAVEDPLSSADHLVAGAVSGFCTRFLCQPFDVIKIRFQLQIEPIRASHATAKYRGILDGTRLIFREEGLTAFWKGHIPAQALSVVYGAAQFSSYEYLVKQASVRFGDTTTTNWANSIHFACGFTSGCVATLFAQPFDVIRTRLVAQAEPKTYHTIHEAVVLMWQQEGPRAFYRGLLPTLLQIGPLSGFQFGFYHFFLHVWSMILHQDENITGIRKSVVCGALSGIVSKTLVYPLDLVKKRLQVQGFAVRDSRTFGSYTGFLHCVHAIFVKEGFLGYFKGYLPSVLKATATTACHFAFYEAACELLRYRLGT
ncbi:mitochondrial thiamine pyrophosphate carrier-like [Ornithodoros turicata]